MPLLLADLIYSRDCKLNLRKNVDTTGLIQESRTRVCKKELPWGYVIAAMGSGLMAA